MAEQSSVMRQVDLTGGATLAAWAAIIYGLILIFRNHGVNDHPGRAYLVLGWAVASIVLVAGYVGVIFNPPKQKWIGLTFAFASAVPFFFSLYLFFVLGLLDGYDAVAKHRSVWSIILAVFWLLAGSRMFYMMRQISRAPTAQRPH